MSNIKLESVALRGTGKKGIVKPNEDGYYVTVLGAYGCQNGAGAFYDEASGRKMFEPNSPLMRQLEKGVLYAELNHPSTEPYIDSSGRLDDVKFLRRVWRVEPDRVCAHIRSIWIDPNFRDENGKRFCAVLGEIRPHGPYGQWVKEAFENGSANAYFSVRSLTEDDNLTRTKYTRAIITYDFVIEGGIAIAQKWLSPALEAFPMMDLNPATLWAAAKQRDQQIAKGVSVEDGDSFDPVALASTLGWGLGTKRKNAAYRGW